MSDFAYLTLDDMLTSTQLISLRPTASFSVPPSTIFSTRPISFYPNAITPASRRTKEKQKARDDTRDLDGQAGDVSGHERITIIGVQKGEKVKHDHEGKVLWVWRGEDGDKEVIIVCMLLEAGSS